jgi:hypothetical protein
LEGAQLDGVQIGPQKAIGTIVGERPPSFHEEMVISSSSAPKASTVTADLLLIIQRERLFVG